MSKKKPKKKSTPTRPLSPARFAAGTQVRVKPGTTDPDFPDIPLGGWAGAIQEVDRRSNPPSCLVEWNQRTLDQMHPIYRRRCQRDDLELESMWLSEEDLEPEAGAPAVMEQPTLIVPRPLSKTDVEDRIRAVFGLTSDDLVPAVTEESLRRYHHYLETQLSFPFQANVLVETGPIGETTCPVTVLGLGDPDDCDVDEGLLCQAEDEGRPVELPLAYIEVTRNRHNRSLLDDYEYWFHNWEDGDFSDTPAAQLEPLGTDALPSGKWFLVKLLGRCAIYGALYGIVLGALLRAMESALVGALVGALLLGFIGFWLGATFKLMPGFENRPRFGRFLGGVMMALAAAAVGAVAGAMLVAFVGTVAGGLAGGLVAGWVTRKWKANRWSVGAMIGAGCGAVAWAYYGDSERAVAGALQGAWMGAGAGIFLLLALIGLPALILLVRGWRP